MQEENRYFLTQGNGNKGIQKNLTKTKNGLVDQMSPNLKNQFICRSMHPLNRKIMEKKNSLIKLGNFHTY